MHVIPSSAQAAYDQASSPCKLAAPRIAASLDELPLSVLCDPDRGTLEAVEFCGLHATEASFVELESVLLKRVTRQARAGSGNENGWSAPFGNLARRAIVAWARKGLWS